MRRGLAKRQTRSRLLLGSLPLLVVAGFLIYAIHLFKSPAHGTIDATPFIADAPAPSVAKTTSAVVEDAYARFRYPENYSLASHNTKAAGVLSYYVLPRHNKDIGGATQFGITIKNVDGTYANDSGYQYRQRHPELYRMSSEKVSGSTVAVFHGTNPDNGYEKVVFWQHGNRLAIIALTANFTDASFDKDFAQLLHSWQWKG